MFSFSPLHAALLPKSHKTVVVTFGGGARDEETFAPEGQENIPHLMKELIPQATFFTQVVNRGILGHYVATASLATGVYERFDNFADIAPENPTVFEYFRKGLGRPANDTWVIAPSNGFNRIGQSAGGRFAAGFGAQVVLPKHLLASALGRSSAKSGGLEFLLQDNYEELLFTPPSVHSDVERSRLTEMLHLSVDDFAQHAKTLSSPDELSVYVMRQLMRQFAPSLLWITLHDMDVAHTGAYSLYLDGIRRTDRLCAEIWQMIESNPEYKGRTTMLVLPDFGRDSDFNASGNGFQHHRTGDPLSRTTWMMAMGPHIRQNLTVDRALDSLDLVPTLGSLMNFATPLAKGRLITEVL
ncbi:hypothetical protein FTO74_09655 [Granulicella sp. WH15]|uniref:hypothetical protein n=1 Tax=Granulicella sp. WH15 TaxID=2602070 RepID=UPI001366F8E8|nr:hypothetical protein [Granulicella sp. WH15]QHN03605.1 hypothetical protein FTO74_09655 [Granulicella sp. WH15]